MSMWQLSSLALLCALALSTGPLHAADAIPPLGQNGQKVFELRTYIATKDKMDKLLARFRDHTVGLFKKHGIEVVGYWVVADGEMAGRKLVYICSFASVEAKETAWKNFREDPEWKKAKADSEVDGPLTELKDGKNQVFSELAAPTDFSAIK